MHIHYKKKYQIKDLGFALTFSVLIGSLLAVLGAFILSIGLKEANLSSSLKESSRVFYAADSAVSCALFYDFQGTGKFMDKFDFANNPYNITCGEFTVSVTPTQISSEEILNSFQLPLDAGNVCATVTVDKIYNPSGTPPTMTTIIKGRAINGSCASRKAIMVERGLQATYEEQE